MPQAAVALGSGTPAQDSSVLHLDHSEEAEDLQVPLDSLLAPVERVEAPQAVLVVLKKFLRALAALETLVPLPLAVLVQAQEKAPLLANLHQLQEQRGLEVLFLGNLSKEIPYLHPSVVASDQVPVGLGPHNPVAQAAALALASAVPVSMARQVLVAQQQLVHKVRVSASEAALFREAALLALVSEGSHVRN